jgi:hypothetical protein
MTQQASKSQVYTVVEVWRGTAVGVKNFRRLRNAQKCAQRLRRRRNLVEDDVQLFQSSIRN